MRYLSFLLLACVFPAYSQSVVETYALREPDRLSEQSATTVSDLPLAPVRDIPEEFSDPPEEALSGDPSWVVEREYVAFDLSLSARPDGEDNSTPGRDEPVPPPAQEMMFVTVDEHGQAMEETPQERAFEQAWLDALLIEQLDLDVRLVNLGLTQDEIDLVLALRLESCPSTTSPRLAHARAVLECRVRQTLDMLAARER